MQLLFVQRMIVTISSNGRTDQVKIFRDLRPTLAIETFAWSGRSFGLPVAPYGTCAHLPPPPIHLTWPHYPLLVQWSSLPKHSLLTLSNLMPTLTILLLFRTSRARQRLSGCNLDHKNAKIQQNLFF